MGGKVDVSEEPARSLLFKGWPVGRMYRETPRRGGGERASLVAGARKRE